MTRTICWFSCGAASAVATKLILKDTPDDLVARLRVNDAEIYLPILGQAADRLEAQAAENERLREANQAAAECVAAMMKECARYRDEIRAALGETQ